VAIDVATQCEVPDPPTDIIRLLLSAGADPKPGLKKARAYRCKSVIDLIEATLVSRG